MFLKLYIFTFGRGHNLSNRYQGVYASDIKSAVKEMLKLHGENWATCYTEEEFVKSLNKGLFRSLKPLKPITQEAI